MYDVTMPKLSDSMEVGKIIEWKVKAGDTVHEGDTLAEIESDKAAMGLECFRDGVIAQILQGDGAEVAVGALIARIAAAGEERKKEVERESVERGASEEETAAEPAAAPSSAVAPSEQPAEIAERPAPRPHAERTEEQRGGRLAVSPLARKLAREHGIDLAALQGSGPDGRIVAADVEAAIKGAREGKREEVERESVEGGASEEEKEEEPAAAPSTLHPPPSTLHAPPSTAVPSPPAPPASGLIKPSADEELPPIEVTPEEADVEEAPFRLKTQARRVTASKHVIPHFYITRGVEVTALFDRKDELKARFGASVTHLIMLAVLKALAQHPEVNRSYDRGKIITWKNVNLGLAVDTESGLTVAVLHHAQGLSLKELVERMGPLVERARTGKLAVEERQHATFTISNLGMFDVEHFEPIVNPPSAITLAVASALPTPVVRQGGLAIGKVMRLTLSCDHRIVDGATAARFLKDLKALLEAPETLLG